MATTKKTSTKTIKKATKKTVAAEQMTLVDALPVDDKPRRAGNWGRKQGRFDKTVRNKHKRY